MNISMPVFKKTCVVLSLIYICLFTDGCKKDQKTSSTVNQDQIVIGSSVGMHEDMFHPGIVINTQVHSQDFDMDQDRTPDFRVIVQTEGGLADGHLVCKVLSLNAHSQLHVYSTTDSVFQHLDTTTTSTYVYFQNYTSCKKIAPGDAFMGVSTTWAPVCHAFGDILHKTDSFHADTLYLKTSAYSYYTYLYSQNNLSYNNEFLVDETCHNFPDNRNCYIGVKLDANGIAKMGWIKLITNPDFTTVFLGTALQW